jgi:hypothetical protein
MEANLTTSINEVRAHAPSLLQRSEVVGVGAGKRIRMGRYEDEDVLTVFVQKKRPLDDLAAEEVLPRTVVTPEGNERGVDVLEMEMPSAPPPPAAGDEGQRFMVASEFAGRVSPFVSSLRTYQYFSRGGLSASNSFFPVGTMTIGVRDRNNPRIRYALSCNHVFGRMGNALPGETILQPSVLDGGTSNQVLAYFSRSAPLAFDGSSPGIVDGSIALCTHRLPVASVQGIGAVTRVRTEASLKSGEWVRKVGRTSGLTYGRILATGATLRVNYSGLGFSNREVLFHRQIVTTGMGAYGDSGSLLLDSKGRGIGMLFSGNSSGNTVFNPLETVLMVLKVTL